jgi:hypothetical protein
VGAVEAPTIRRSQRCKRSGRAIKLNSDALVAAEVRSRCSLVQRATAGRVSYRLTPRVLNNQNAEVSHNTIRMTNSTPPAMGSAQPG